MVQSPFTNKFQGISNAYYFCQVNNSAVKLFEIFPKAAYLVTLL